MRYLEKLETTIMLKVMVSPSGPIPFSNLGIVFNSKLLKLFDYKLYTENGGKLHSDVKRKKGRY